MTEWKMLKIERTADYERINKAFAEQTTAIAPDRNPSEYRRLYVTYKEALKFAAKEHAVMEGRRAEDLDFDFRDDRYLDEFMRILDNICSSGLKQMLSVWKSLVDDSDYRTLQRTDTFIAAFDRYMSNISGLDAEIWKYLINHFKVYGFSAQNKKLIANLQKYGSIKEDVFIKNDVFSPQKPEAKQKKTKSDSWQQRQIQQTAQPQRQMQSQKQEQRPTQPQRQIQQTVPTHSDQLLAKYMELQDDRIVNELSSDFFKKFGRIYSHEITKNNLSAWRYLMQDEKYIHLLKQAGFTEKIANSLRYVNDLYSSVWEYIIDKTRVPESHPMYQKTTGELIRLMKKNRYSGEIMPQGVIQTEYLKSIIDEDNFSIGHHDYPKTESANEKRLQPNINPNVYKNVNKNNGRNAMLAVIFIIFMILSLISWLE